MIRVLVLLVAWTALVRCQSLQLAIQGNGPIRAGNTIQVSMSLAGGGGSGIVGLQELFTPSTGGTVTAADGPANTAAGKHVQCAVQTSGGFLCLDVGLNATAYADGVVHSYTLIIPATATPGQSSLVLSGVIGVNAAGSGVPVSGSTVNFTLASPISPCDLDGSGAVDSSDFSAAKDQALGLAVCADLNGDGKCSVIDVQRVANAALGGACKTGA